MVTLQANKPINVEAQRVVKILEETQGKSSIMLTQIAKYSWAGGPVSPLKGIIRGSIQKIWRRPE